MDLGLQKKKVLITGGCNGIGRTIAEKFAEQNCSLILTTRSKKKSINFIEKIKKKTKVKIIEVDFLKKNWFSNFKKKISSEKKIDILINNAGHTLNITNPYCDVSSWKKIIDLNFLTAVQISNLIIKKMKKNNWGRIINITSCAGLENSGPVTYCVSKAQLTAYTRTMGRILASENENIIMTAIFPGVIKTRGGHWEKILKNNPGHAQRYLKERTPLKRFGTEEEFANVILFYSSTKCLSSHGSIIAADGGQSRHYMYYNYI